MIEDLDGLSPHKMNLSPEIAMLFAKVNIVIYITE